MNNINHTSQSIKAAFAQGGMNVRVRDISRAFRICPSRDNTPFDKSTAMAIAASLGLTCITGELGGQFNGSRELIGYKPGMVARA